MAQLVYWSLLEYDHVPVVRTARIALTVQMEALLLTQWRDKRHICPGPLPGPSRGLIVLHSLSSFRGDFVQLWVRRALHGHLR